MWKCLQKKWTTTSIPTSLIIINYILNYYYHNNNTDNCLFTMFAVSAINPQYHGLQWIYWVIYLLAIQRHCFLQY